LHHPAFQAPLLEEEGTNLLLFKEEYPEGGRWWSCAKQAKYAIIYIRFKPVERVLKLFNC
jgi:hypothetical protein